MTGRDIKIEGVRKVTRKVANKALEAGATPQEIAIGTVLATFDVAERFAGPDVLAIEWLRTTIDVLESGILSGSFHRGS